MDISNKVIFITGGLGGIGLSITKQFLKEGAKGVALADLDTSREAEVLEQFNKWYGLGKVIVIKTDVTKDEDVKNALDKTVETFKNLDVVICGAGVFYTSWEKIIDINFKGATRTLELALKEYIPKYRSTEDGVLINISSIGGLDPFPEIATYCATKAALISLSRCYSLPYHYEMYKVKILTICPGATETPMLQFASTHPTFQPLLKGYKLQKPDQLAQQLSKIVKTFEPGDVYVIEDDKSYPLQFGDRTSMQRKEHKDTKEKEESKEEALNVKLEKLNVDTKL